MRSTLCDVVVGALPFLAWSREVRSWLIAEPSAESGREKR